MGDLSKQRRFALSVGLALFVYSLAVVKLDPNATIWIFIIQKPEWLLGGLMLASVYALYQYILHAFQFSENPMRSRIGDFAEELALPISEDQGLTPHLPLDVG